MATDKLYITISDNRGDGSKGTPNASGSPSNNVAKTKEEDNALGRYIEHEMFHIVKNTTTKTVNFTLSNIGNFTGDYITQRKIDRMKSAISGVVTLGTTTLAGAKYGPVGAVVGFVAGASSLVADTVFDSISIHTDLAKQNFDIAQLRKKTGLNTIYDGSRGTEN